MSGCIRSRCVAKRAREHGVWVETGKALDAIELSLPRRLFALSRSIVRLTCTCVLVCVVENCTGWFADAIGAPGEILAG